MNARPLFTTMVLLAAMAGGLTLWSGLPAAYAQDEDKPAAAEKPAAAPTDAELLEDFTPRLPIYYNRVIDGVQREKIYKMQEGYYLQIRRLELQIEALEAERDAAAEGFLRPEQKQRLAEIVKEELAKKASGVK